MLLNRIYIAGHRGMAGSSILRNLQAKRVGKQDLWSIELPLILIYAYTLHITYNPRHAPRSLSRALARIEVFCQKVLYSLCSKKIFEM